MRNYYITHVHFINPAHITTLPEHVRIEILDTQSQDQSFDKKQSVMIISKIDTENHQRRSQKIASSVPSLLHVFSRAPFRVASL